MTRYNLWLSAVLLAAGFLLRPQTAAGELVKSAVLETNVAYLRIDQTGKGLPDEITSALNDLEASNRIAGIVLDLRFATGADADDLKSVEGVLEGNKLPLAILINAQTGGAAATLAEDLRSAKAGLVFGAAADNLQPDIAVAVTTEDEKRFFKNPYGALAQSGANSDGSTNLLPFVDIDHTTEADLVRDRIKDGEQENPRYVPVSAQPSESQPSESQQPIIRDPVLAHGVDFIKGLAALRLNGNEG